jgi:hypothetical protein
LRQPILYAEELWRRQRVFAFLLPVFGVAILGLSLYQRRGGLDANAPVGALWAVLGLLWGGGLYLNRVRSALDVTDAGLKVSRGLRDVVIPYDLIRSVRVQRLEMHFQDARKRLIRPMWKPLMAKPAIFIRLRAEDPRLATLRGRLGGFLTPGLIADDMVAVPVPDPDALAWEVTSRLPDKTGVNLGGQRRKRRPR